MINTPYAAGSSSTLRSEDPLITTQDGALILFEFRGRTIFEGDEPGRQNLVGWFESDYETYRWLNDLVCVAEGLITDAAWRSTCTRAYTTRAIESLRGFYRASSILRLEAMAGPGSVDEAALSACLRGDRLPLGP